MPKISCICSSNFFQLIVFYSQPGQFGHVFDIDLHLLHLPFIVLVSRVGRPASSRMGTPSSCALVSLLPASLPRHLHSWFWRPRWRETFPQVFDDPLLPQCGLMVGKVPVKRQRQRPSKPWIGACSGRSY